MPKQAPARLKGISEREKGSGVFWIRWTDAEGRRHYEKAGPRGAAESLLSKRKQEVIVGKKQPELLRSKAVTFAELCDDAVKYSADANSEKQTYELELRIKKFKATFGHRRADSIKKSEIIDWLAEQTRENEWKPSSRNRAQAAFSLIFRVGIDNEKIDRNPAARIRRKTENNARVRFLSDEEERLLLKTIDARFPQFRAHFLVSIHTGMRMGEQYSLDWRDVDLERHDIYLSKTKNKHPRTVRLNSVALAAFKSLKPADGHLRGPVFPSVRTSESLQGSRGWFPTTVTESGIAHYSWHCNRHTTASRLVMAGVDLRTVAEILGHRSLQMVMRYAHLAPEHQASAMDTLVPDARRRVVTKSATSRFRAKKAKRMTAVSDLK